MVILHKKIDIAERSEQTIIQMVSINTLLLSIKVFLVCTGVISLATGLRLSIPSVIDFACSEVVPVWTTVQLLLKPPYLYVVVNGIIVVIAVSSRFHHGEHELSMPSPQRVSIKVHVPSDFNLVSAQQEHYPVVTNSIKLYHGEDMVVNGQEEAKGNGEETDVEDDDENDGEHGDDSEDEDRYIVEKHMYIQPEKVIYPDVQSELFVPVRAKPPVSSRFGGRKADYEGGRSRSMKIAQPRRQELTLESAWEMITKGRQGPVTRHLTKADTWEHSHELDSRPEHVLKSATFKERSSNYELLPLPPPCPALETYRTSSKIQKESSLDQDELNRRAEEFIKKFNEDMRLQRQESLNQFMDMINRAV